LTVDCTPLAGSRPPLAGEAETFRPPLRILLQKVNAMAPHLDRWLVRAAILGGIAALIGAGLFWLILTRPVEIAGVLHKAF
jgi:hypothetical protein